MSELGLALLFAFGLLTLFLFPVMIALALVPPLFFRIMDPRLDQIESIKASNSQQSP